MVKSNLLLLNCVRVEQIVVIIWFVTFILQTVCGSSRWEVKELN